MEVELRVRNMVTGSCFPLSMEEKEPVAKLYEKVAREVGYDRVFSLYCGEGLVEWDEEATIGDSAASHGSELRVVHCTPAEAKRKIEKMGLEASTSREALLCRAAFAGDTPRLELFLAAGWDYNCKDKGWRDRTPLFAACEIGRDPVVSRLLLAGADTEVNTMGRTPLAAAASNGNESSARLLLNARADPNTGVFDAAINGRLSILEMLLEAGANPSPTRPGTRETPLHFLAERVNIAEALVNAGARVDPRDSSGETPLFRAVRSPHHRPFVQLLLRSRADPNACDHSGASIISRAHSVIAPVLIRGGARPELLYLKKGGEDNLEVGQAEMDDSDEEDRRQRWHSAMCACIVQ